MATAFIPPDYFRRYSVTEIFGNGQEYEVDLGCGDGGFLLAVAQQHPDRLYLGVERLLGRLRKVCSRGDRLGLQNVRALRAEGLYFLEWMVEPGSIRRLHYLFPDPWPKEKHHKKRLVQEETVPTLHRALAPGGELLFRTDHEEYYEWVCACVKSSALFEQTEWPDLEDYPDTDFQRQWESQGRSIHSARFISKA